MKNQQRSIIEELKEDLKYRQDEGSDLIRDGMPGFTPNYENLLLLVDEKSRAIITKEKWWSDLTSKNLSLIIATRIDDPKIISIRTKDINNLTQIDKIQDLELIKGLQESAYRFLENRMNDGGPYYQIFGGFPSWGYNEKYPFNIYLSGSLDAPAIVEKIDDHWGWFSGETCNGSISLRIDQIGHRITKKDEALICMWAGIDATSDEDKIVDRHHVKITEIGQRYIRLIHARFAEKFAYTIYSSLSIDNLEDVSILQLKGDDGRWRKFDIWADRPLDVKNARIYRSNKRQNFVPKFKKFKDKVY